MKKNSELLVNSLTAQEALEESSRCLLCEDAPCSKGCPAGTDPARFIRQIRFDNLKGAARTVRNNNILGSVCAFTCPVDTLCEKSCTAKKLGRPINISGLQRFAYEYGRAMGLEPIERSGSGRGKVAVIGAGPAGISASAELLKLGYDVTIFEKEKELGGIAAWNIPPYRISLDALDHDIANLKKLRATFRLGEKIEGNDAVTKLFSDGFKAIFVGTGLSRSVTLGFMNGFSNVTTASEFLRDARLSQNAYDLKNKFVVVIGGGAVAMDSASTAVRLGARRVYTVSLEGVLEMPADEAELSIARQLGVIFKPSCKITEVISVDKKAVGLKGIEIEWKENGNLSPTNAVPVEGTEFQLKCDLVIQAIGSRCGEDVGFLSIADDLSTNLKGVFAAGDVTGKCGTISEAVGQGKKASVKIDEYLRSL